VTKWYPTCGDGRNSKCDLAGYAGRPWWGYIVFQIHKLRNNEANILQWIEERHFLDLESEIVYPVMFFRLVDKQSDTVMTERPAGTWNVTQTFFYYCRDGKDLPGPTTGTTPGTSTIASIVTAVTDTSGPDIAGTATPSEPIGGGAWAAIGIAIAFVVSVGFGIAIRFRENITKFVSDAYPRS